MQKVPNNPTPEQIRQARKSAGLTQTQAAALIHSTMRTLQDWEAGINRMHPGLWELFQAKIAPVSVDFGRDGLMAIAAFRYCLGRSTYIVGDCADWLIQCWPGLPDTAKAIIRRDLEESFAKDDGARQDGSEYLPLGHDCDRSQWERVRNLWGEGEKQ